MPRNLVWIKTQSFVDFGCFDCQWVDKTTGTFIGKSLDQMKRAYEAERDKEFATHDCFKFPKMDTPMNNESRSSPNNMQRHRRRVLS